MESGHKHRRAPGEPGARQVEYRLEEGLRHVEPYDFEYTTYAKQRWVGRELLEVFCKEFVAYSEEYYRAAIETGRITVNGQSTAVDHILQQNERIVHRAEQCRENPVLAGEIRSLAETSEVLVVDKPASMPIHPCGSYRYNCLVAVLKNQGTAALGAALHTTHRLDRLTSGVVLLAKTKESARQISTWFADNKIRKTYLARVRGDASVLFGNDASLPAGVTKTPEGRLKVRGFIRCVCYKVGKHEFSVEHPGDIGEPKEAVTEFEYVGKAKDGEGGPGESIVRCLPLTGRTHQIRVHLLHLGFPIANDSCYGGELRNDPFLPLIPHVHHALGGDKFAAAKPEESVMHPSGIFLHALVYRLPDGSEFSSDSPAWAKCD